MEELRILQIETTDRIARNREKEEKYQQMLNEARMADISDERSVSDNLKEEKEKEKIKTQVEDLKEILERVEKCINLVNHDRSKCKSELKNLRYYLKALIANDSEK